MTRRALSIVRPADRHTFAFVSCLEDLVARGAAGGHASALERNRVADQSRAVKRFLATYQAWRRENQRTGVSLVKQGSAAVFTVYQGDKPKPPGGWPMLILPWKGSFDAALELVGDRPRFAGPRPRSEATPAVPPRRAMGRVEQGTYFLP
jgi:hypothetical protein